MKVIEMTMQTTWSLGDWHEYMVALSDDTNGHLVCWLQNNEWTKEGANPGQVQHLIKAAPELLAAATTVSNELGKAINSGSLSWSEEQLFLRWVRILMASMESAAGINPQGVVFNPRTLSPSQIAGVPK